MGERVVLVGEKIHITHGMEYTFFYQDISGYQDYLLNEILWREETHIFWEEKKRQTLPNQYGCLSKLGTVLPQKSPKISLILFGFSPFRITEIWSSQTGCFCVPKWGFVNRSRSRTALSMRELSEDVINHTNHFEMTAKKPSDNLRQRHPAPVWFWAVLTWGKIFFRVSPMRGTLFLV